MNFLEAIILGIIQGATEFIPVSSSGHLIIFGSVLDLDNRFEFDVLLNLGTLAALVYYTRKDLLGVFRQFLSGRLELAIKLVVSTLPAVFVGLLFNEQIQSLNQQTKVVVFMLIVVGGLMLFVKQAKKPKTKLEQVSYGDALLIGLAQTLALIPGTSRSGITILAALMIGHSRGLSARWSFLMAVPVVFAATVKVLLSASGVELLRTNFWSVFAGNMASFIVGLIAIDFLFKVLKNSNLKLFGLYRIALGAVIIFLLSFNLI